MQMAPMYSSSSFPQVLYIVERFILRENLLQVHHYLVQTSRGSDQFPANFHLLLQESSQDPMVRLVLKPFKKVLSKYHLLCLPSLSVLPPPLHNLPVSG